MRVFKVKSFARFTRKENINDRTLADAVADMERGLIDADLGGGLIKQRAARAGAGKRGGFRILVAYSAGGRAVFLFGFAKSDQANLSPEDTRDLRDYGALLLALGDKDIERMTKNNELTEIDYG